MFAVRCTICGRRFEVERAPATCRACGGLAVAG
jgi:rRNA maturation endonuclease Nob1